MQVMRVKIRTILIVILCAVFYIFSAYIRILKEIYDDPRFQMRNKNLYLFSPKSIFSCNPAHDMDKDFKWLTSRDLRTYVRPNENTIVLEANDVCGSDQQQSIFLLVVVPSSVPHFEARRTIRSTWGRKLLQMRPDIRLVFFLGLTSNSTLQLQVAEEAYQFQDIIQDGFCDAYQNLTIKTVAILKWATQRCPQATFVMKCDDDNFIHPNNLLKLLQNHPQASHLIDQGVEGLKEYLFIGRLYTLGFRHWNRESKWYIPKKLYPDAIFPPYLRGSSYVFSGSLLSQLYETALDTPFINLEDVFLTGLVAKQRLGLSLEHCLGFHSSKPLHSCAYKDVILVDNFSPQQLLLTWRKVELLVTRQSIGLLDLCNNSFTNMIVKMYAYMP